ncbi:putative efflux protein, MATE family [Tindallia magadiensis]|uniref:Multidrug export protein MepA n=1 Tax=Tindallia magadiensis TaxID=69895 RepID=A0A1I3B0Y6_9FIRM|nr:MATE family efflux transporter [Tindallia magadiensis]SFH55975.1 putative efflux protein, MATE family [Tindallia magadiensis]
MDRGQRLGSEKILTLLVRLSAPATVAMLVNALYNIIDTIFIGRGVGYLGIGGLTVAFPVQMAIMALAQTIGIGAASATSRNLGAGEVEKAKKVAGNSFLASMLMGAVVFTVGNLMMNPILKMFGATDTLLPYAKEYLRIILIGSLYFPFVVNANNLIRSEGNSKVAMISMIVGAVINTCLDYLFIFPMNMGIKGAALATITSQFFSLLYVLCYFYGENSLIKVKIRHLKFDWSIQKEILKIGSSSFARQIAGSLMAIAINNSLAFYGGDLALSVFGIVQRVMMFLFMPMFGIVQGMQPIVGYNYASGNAKRVIEVVKLAITGITVMAVVSTILGQLFPASIIRLFDDSQEVVETGILALRISIAMIPIVGVQIVGAALFQSLGKVIPALVLTISRQILFLIPLVLVLPKIGGLGLIGIWISFPLADLLSTVFTSFWVKKQINELKRSIQ